MLRHTFCSPLVRRFDSRRGMRNFLFTTASRPALEPTQPPSYPGVKRPQLEADHSRPSNAKVKNVWRYTSVPIRLHGVVLRRTGTTLPCNTVAQSVQWQGYGLDDRRSIPGRGGVLCHRHRLQIGVSLPRGKVAGREADHSPPSRAEVKNAWRYTSTPPIRLHFVVLS